MSCKTVFDKEKVPASQPEKLASAGEHNPAEIQNRLRPWETPKKEDKSLATESSKTSAGIEQGQTSRDSETAQINSKRTTQTTW